MCLAIPMQVTEIIDDDMVSCHINSSTTSVSVSSSLLPSPLDVGDYIIVHAGFALRKLDPKDAEETLALLREMAEIAQEEHLAF